MRVRKVGVIGAGAMGTGIASLCASAGVPVLLLDVPSEGSDRSALARGAVARSLKAKPAPLMVAQRAELIEPGNTDDDIARLSDCDWVVEAIVEKLGPKRALYERLEQVVHDKALVTSNTSSIPIRLLTEGRGDAFKARFFGTHFFNPVRYLHLLEVIPTAETLPDVIAAMRAFGERALGKGVVVAKDAPGFIANRLGLYGVRRALQLMQECDLTIDDVDQLTGVFLGRPKSAVFRTMDISGIDVLQYVAESLSATSGEDFSLPEWVRQLVASGRLGEKTGAGFYKKDKAGIQTLNWKTLEYAPQNDRFPADLAHLTKLPLPERLRGITRASGTGAEFLRRFVVDLSYYILEKTPDLAHDITSVDRALEWGYGWEMGPFRQMDALGMDFLRSAFADRPAPPLLTHAQEAFYRELNSGTRQLVFSGGYAPVEAVAGLIDLPQLHSTGKTLLHNESAAVVDIGDGVLLLEFRAKMNTLGPGVLALLEQAAERVRTGAYEGLVVGNADPRTFSAGADLSLVAAQVQTNEWTALDKAIHAFQQGVMSIRRLPFPVVVAPFGLTLGGGCEMMLHADVVQAHAELYCGLVEVGVGLIPGGGGTKELLFRFSRELAPYDEADPFEGVKRAFKLISMATTATSALEAQALGLLRASDRISMNRDRLLADAKARVRDLAADYAPPPPARIRALGKEAFGNLEYAVWAMREAGYISDHDVRIGTQLAYVLSGGDGPPRDVTEQDVLDLEREAFLHLLGTKETQERIVHMLKTGKPLRN